MINTSTPSMSQVHLMEDHHQALLALCGELEDLATGLERNMVPAMTRRVAAQLEPLVEAAQTLEEETLYPNLEERAGSCFSSLMIAQIKAEHGGDRKAAHEISLTLRAVADGRCTLSLDTVARMTKGFQDYLRRHVAAEQTLLDTLLATVEPPLAPLMHGLPPFSSEDGA